VPPFIPVILSDRRRKAIATARISLIMHHEFAESGGLIVDESALRITSRFAIG